MNRFDVDENMGHVTINSGKNNSETVATRNLTKEVNSVRTENATMVENSTMVAYDDYRKAHYGNAVPDSRILVFLTGFCIGMVFFYLSKGNTACPLGREQIVWMQSIDIYQIGLLEYIFSVRFKQLIFFGICALSSIGGMLAYLIMGWYGFEIGVIIFSLVYQYGLKGIFFTFCMFMPQALFYLAAFLVIFNRYWEGDRTSYHKEETINSKSILRNLEKIKKPIAVLILFCLGMLCEAYVNPMIMKKMAMFF